MNVDLLVELQKRSREACDRAYAPYSGFQVGAAALFDGSSQIFSGANVENASYGGTMCAERSAIFAGVSAGLRKLTRLAVCCRDKHGEIVVGDCCGMCLQVMAEFAQHDMPISFSDGRCLRLFDLLPRPFKL